VASIEDPAGYLYRTALNLFRGRARRTATALRKVAGRLPPVDAMRSVEDRDVLLRALASVSPSSDAVTPVPLIAILAGLPPGRGADGRCPHRLAA
jgi:hypothetical protein